MSTPSVVGIAYHPLLNDAGRLAHDLAEGYAARSQFWTSPTDGLGQRKRDLDATDLLLTIGGDGTILRVVHESAPRGIPVLGINMGRVGFMSELDADDAEERLGWYLDGNARSEFRCTLQSEITDSGREPLYALNDIVVGRGREIRIIDLRVSINGAYLETYRADAMVVATATGSTGYSLALGGPVMDPESESFLLKPVAAHMSLQGGLVLPRHSAVEIVLESDQDAVVSADGFNNVPLTYQQTVRIQTSPHRAVFLRRRPPAAFYETLTRRLGMRQQSMPRRRRAERKLNPGG